MKKYNYLRLGFFTFFIFLIFSFFVTYGIFTNFDYRFTVKLQSIVPDFFITPFSVFSVLGTFEVTAIVLLVLVFLYPGIKKIYVLGLFALVMFIEIAGKSFIKHPPPPLKFLKTDISLGFPTGEVSRNFFSYPSGHSARTAFLSGFIIILILASDRLSKTQKQILIIGILIFDFIMFVSRVYLGEHWVTDVVGGVLLGFSIAFFTAFLLKPSR